MRILAALVVASVALTGCTFGPTEAIDDNKPAFTLDVTAIVTTAGHCATGGPDHTCHTLTVTVDNSNNAGDLAVGNFVWEADDGEGGVYAPPQVEGPDAIARGAVRSITLGFSVDENDKRLVELRYENRDILASAPIRGY